MSSDTCILIMGGICLFFAGTAASMQLYHVINSPEMSSERVALISNIWQPFAYIGGGLAALSSPVATVLVGGAMTVVGLFVGNKLQGGTSPAEGVKEKPFQGEGRSLGF